MLTLRRLHIAAAALLAATLDDTSLAHTELRQESTAHATHNVVYDVLKPVASSSRRRFEGKHDDVIMMRSRETGDNATH